VIVFHARNTQRQNLSVKSSYRHAGKETMSIMHAAQATHPLFHFIPTIPDQLTYVGSDREDEEAQYTWKNSPTTRTGGLEIVSAIVE